MSASRPIAPVSRGVFFCKGQSDADFYVEVIDGYERRQHPRADPSRLHHLLTYVPPVGPALTKKGEIAKRQPQPHVDESEHFYCAQLLHYGLKPLKTKAAAKKALLAAFGEGKTLEVPWNIVKLKQELQTEYKRESTKAKAKAPEVQKGSTGSTSKKTAKKDPLTLLLASNEAGGSKFEAPKSPAKKRKATSVDVEAGPAKKVKNDAGSAAVPSNLKLKKEVSDTKTPLPAAFKKKNLNLKELTSANNAQTPTSQTPTKSSTKLDSSDTQGQYEIDAPFIREQWSNADFFFQMAPSRSTQRHLWVNFDFGIVSGIMRSTTRPTKTKGATCHFVWRGNESGEDVMTFGKDHTASITFLGDGKIKGNISGSFLGKNCSFTGSRVEKKNVVWVMSVKGWKQRWRGINEKAYEAASVGRWGKWVDTDGCVEGPAGSDTTAGEDRDGYGDSDVEMDDVPKFQFAF